MSLLIDAEGPRIGSGAWAVCGSFSRRFFLSIRAEGTVVCRLLVSSTDRLLVSGVRHDAGDACGFTRRYR